MDKNKAIEEMKKLLCSVEDTVCSDCPFKFNGKCGAEEIAEGLVNAGYGDVKQAVEEFAEKLKSGAHKFGLIDGKNYYVWFDNEIDDLITELYGTDEKETKNE